MPSERITVDPERMNGLACVRDTTVTVAAIIDALAGGQSADELLARYPELDRADIVAALEFAVAAVRDRQPALVGLA
ncbi:MAG: DUF433 domain-containing protein [Frankia sp.]|nr:DUF433 domain-containing protein [Frankia sp.]